MKLDRLAHFSAVVEAASFTRAAERLGVTKAVVSAHVAKLEEELGVALLVRTTRRVSPTEAGRRLYERCRIILREAEDAVDEASQDLSEPRGLLRLTAPNDYGQAVVAPVVAEFRRRHPACRVRLDLDDQLSDMGSGLWDLAIRLGWLEDSSLKSRRIGGFAQYLVAAPEICGEASGLRRPCDLVGLPFAANSALREPGNWSFTHLDGRVESIRVDPAVLVNTTPALLATVLSGAGCAILPDFLVEAHLRAGRLVHLAPDWILRRGGIHIVYPSARFRAAKVSVFTEALIAALKARGGEEPRRLA